MGKKIVDIVLAILTLGITAIVRHSKRHRRPPEFDFSGKITPSDVAKERMNETEARKR